jgi:opacity protein-like surface antigen
MKNKLSLILSALLFVSSAVFAQSKETRNVDTFTKLSFRAAGKLYLRQGTPQKVELEGRKDVLAKIETEVSGGKLVIGTADKWTRWNRHDDDEIIVYITVENLDAVGVSGSGDLIAQTKLTGNDFDLKVSGSGTLEAEVEATGAIQADVSGSGRIDLKGKSRNFESSISGSGKVMLAATIAERAEFQVSGSGRVTASGTAKDVRSTISGSGSILAANLEADKCEVRISGSGDVQINVKSELDATISGSGSVSYRGNPSHVNSNASGSGHISKM